MKYWSFQIQKVISIVFQMTPKQHVKVIVLPHKTNIVGQEPPLKPYFNFYEILTAFNKLKIVSEVAHDN